MFTSEAENFPIVLLEAMSAGLAIITTIGTGCSEVVGDDAVLVEARNAEAIRQGLIKLTGDPALCARLGKAQRKRMEDYFTWTSVAGRHAEFYKKHVRPLQAIVAQVRQR